MPISEEKDEPKGKSFERLVAAVQSAIGPDSQVEWDRRMMAKSGARRQIDVVVRIANPDATVLIAVEAKDRSSPVSINMVGDFFTAVDGIQATKGIMVSSFGYSKEALLEAHYRGIDTCILRPARNEDWEGYLRSLRMAITAKKLIYEEAEIELVTGEKQPISPGGMEILKSRDGENVFFDHLVNTWLAENKWSEGQHLQLTAVPKLFTTSLESDELIEVEFLRCRPTYIDGFRHEGILQRPEDWIYMKVLPNGQVGEKTFLEFKDLKQIADGFRRKRNRKP